MADTATALNLFIAFQNREVISEDLKFQVLFLAPLMHQAVVSKYLTHVSDTQAFKNI